MDAVTETMPFVRTMADGPRKIAVCGHFGSGKTEFSVSLAMAMARLGCTPMALCDLDIENPYFRSRERQELLESVGVRVYSDPFHGRNASELQVIDPAIRAPLENEHCRVILDCGGDHTGAMILNQFSRYLQEDTALLCVVNSCRPGTDTPQKALEQLRLTEETTGLRVTGLVSNAHLVRFTTSDTVREGLTFAREVEQLSGVPLVAVCAMEGICRLLEREGSLGAPLFPIGMYMRDSYLDKEV